MSTWTHVNGAIRLDTIIGINQHKVEEILGRIITFDKLEAESDTTLPLGSEGTIEYQLVSYGWGNDLANSSVLIYGDLRDYENLGNVIDWFRGVIRNIQTNVDVLGFMVRQGVIEAYVESQRGVLCSVIKTYPDPKFTVEYYDMEE